MCTDGFQGGGTRGPGAGAGGFQGMSQAEAMSLFNQIFFILNQDVYI